MDRFDTETDRKLCIVVSKGTLDGAYPSLIMANAAVTEGIDTHLFFTFWGMDVITKKKMGNLSVTPVGNTSMPIPQALAPLPGMATMATKMMKKQIADLDVPDVPEFMEMLHDMGVTMWACRMSVDMMDLDKDDFFEGVEDIISAGEFMEINEGAQLLFT
jgi:peroxiredoxin family protein